METILDILTSIFFLTMLGHYFKKFLPHKVKILTGDKPQVIKYKPAFFGKDNDMRLLLDKEGLDIIRYDKDTKTYIVKVFCSECSEMVQEAIAINDNKFMCLSCRAVKQEEFADGGEPKQETEETNKS